MLPISTTTIQLLDTNKKGRPRATPTVFFMSASSLAATAANPWVRILDALEKKINRHSYDTWLKPTRYSHSSNGIMYVRVPTADFRHVQDKYADLIQEALDNLNMDRKSK